MEHGSMDESEGQRFLDVFEDKTTDIPENLFEKLYARYFGIFLFE